MDKILEFKANVEKHGFEVSLIGYTLQWTMTNGQTCIMYFSEDGEWIKSEHI